MMLKLRLIRISFTNLIVIATTLALSAGQAMAFPKTLNDWQARYNPPSTTGDNAACQTCHVNDNGGDPWNGYGWDILNALADQACDLNSDGAVSNNEAFFCTELNNSDFDGSNYDNSTEIGLNTQPGWTNGATNNHYFRSGMITTNNVPPENIGQVDPDGTEPPPPPPPLPPTDDDNSPKGQNVRDTIVVKPGDSIQAAIDRAAPGTRIYIKAGTYTEPSNVTNGLNITKSGISLIGQKTPTKGVIIESTGEQRNGVVVVPPEVTDCMACHASMEPPFELHHGVEPGLPDPEPLLWDIEIRSITIKGFENNGLFLERVDGYNIIDVHSVDNRNYGIFPTLSKNGLISHSSAVGSDHDSGIWVETSSNVKVLNNYVAGNVNGFEVSNSDDILLANNIATENTVGAAILLLPDIFDDRPGAKRIDIRNNHIYNNNKVNTARPGSILATIPQGTGIMYLGVDDSTVENNLIEDNNFSGVVIVDYCVGVDGTPNACGVDPTTLTPGFIEDNAATGNKVIGNTLNNNGLSPSPHPFAFSAADLTLFSFEPSNCYADNVYSTYFSILEVYGLYPGLPSCP